MARYGLTIACHSAVHESRNVLIAWIRLPSSVVCFPAFPWLPLSHSLRCPLLQEALLRMTCYVVTKCCHPTTYSHFGFLPFSAWWLLQCWPFFIRETIFGHPDLSCRPLAQISCLSYFSSSFSVEFSSRNFRPEYFNCTRHSSLDRNSY